jgi:hypothetical protein
MIDDCTGEHDGPVRPRALQFRLRTLLIVTALFGLVFGVLRWLGASPETGFVVLAVIGVSVAAALALVVVIAGWVAGEAGEDDKHVPRSHAPRGNGKAR